MEHAQVMTTGEKRGQGRRKASTQTETPPPVPKIKLQTLDDVRRELNTVYRDMRAGRIDNGPKLAYVLGELVKLHMAIDFKQRLEAVERQMLAPAGAADVIDADGALLIAGNGGRDD